MFDDVCRRLITEMNERAQRDEAARSAQQAKIAQRRAEEDRNVWEVLARMSHNLATR
jgi:hypothetical protein